MLPGRWCRVERFYVPEGFIQNLLTDMPNAFLNSAGEKRHLRPPVWRETSRVFHYRNYDINDLVTAFTESGSEPLKLDKTYLGDKEVAEKSMPLDGREALEAAKQRARSGMTIKSPTLQLQIVVGRGQGRATREFEIIWWPGLFTSSTHGKLTLRFYVSKVLL